MIDPRIIEKKDRENKQCKIDNDCSVCESYHERGGDCSGCDPQSCHWGEIKK